MLIVAPRRVMLDMNRILPLIFGIGVTAVWTAFFVRAWRTGELGVFRPKRNSWPSFRPVPINRVATPYAYWLMMGLAALILPLVWLLLIYALLP